MLVWVEDIAVTRADLLRASVPWGNALDASLGWVGILQTLWSNKVLAISIYLVYTSWENFGRAFSLPFTKCLLYYYSIVTFWTHLTWEIK